MLRTTLLVLCVSIPLALSACGGDDASPSSDSGSSTEAASSGGTADVSISETEYQLDPSDPTAEAGSVTIEAVNDGSIVHDLVIEGNGVDEEIEDLEPGASDEVTIDLDPGTYAIYCSIADHRADGMDGELTVE